MTVTTTAIVVAVFVFILSACVGSSKGFSIEGRLLNMNQADFYLYSPDGVINGIDTIHVAGGRFTYEKPINQEGIVIIVFPNFATIPIFVEKGATIDIDGNAANLKDIEITGTDDNEEFTEWRKNSNQLSPPELKKHAERFIEDHPGAPASRWLLMQHFITCPKPDYAKAKKLLDKMKQASNNNVQVTRLSTMLNPVGQLNIGDRLPSFTAKDIDGNTVTSAQYMKGNAIILVWTSWNYESQNIMRQVASKQKASADSINSLKVLAICLDPDVKQCRKTMKNNASEQLTTVCDGKMVDSPLIQLLGLNNIPDNIKLKDGKVTGRRMPPAKITAD